MRVPKPGSAKGIHGSAEAAARILSSCPSRQAWRFRDHCCEVTSEV